MQAHFWKIIGDYWKNLRKKPKIKVGSKVILIGVAGWRFLEGIGCFRVAWKVSGRCLEGPWNFPIRYLEGSLDIPRLVPGRFLGGSWEVPGRSGEVLGFSEVRSGILVGS